MISGRRNPDSTLGFSGFCASARFGRKALWHVEVLSRFQPRRCGPAFGFEIVDRGFFFHRQADIIEAVEQAVLFEGVDFEGDLSAIRAFDRLRLKINREGRVRAALGIFHQLVDLLLGQGDGQDAVLETVVIENVGKAGRDDAADTEIKDRPRRVLAGRAATEIIAGDQHFGFAVGGFIQHEIRVLGPIIVVAHLGKERDAEASTLDGFEILLGDNHVGVDIDLRQRRGNAVEFVEFFHDLGPFVCCG